MSLEHPFIIKKAMDKLGVHFIIFHNTEKN